MKAINRALFGLIIVCLFLSSCTAEEDNSSQDQSPVEEVEPGSFVSYLDLFEETKSYASWDEKVVDYAAGVGGVYDRDEVQDKTLRKHFSPFGQKFHHLIPTQSLINLDPEFSNDISDPINAYQFWATYKYKGDAYWLTCVLAIKKEWVTGVGYHEFHAHPVLLITYDKAGQLVDQLLWTYLIDDAVQIYDDVDVVNGLFVSGYSRGYGEEIEKIYAKTQLNEDGKFSPVFRKEPTVSNEDEI